MTPLEMKLGRDLGTIPQDVLMAHIRELRARRVPKPTVTKRAYGTVKVSHQPRKKRAKAGSKAPAPNSPQALLKDLKMSKKKLMELLAAMDD